MKKTLVKLSGILICLSILLGYGMLYRGGVFELPDRIVLMPNEQRTFSLSIPLQIQSQEQSVDVIKVNDQTLSQTGSVVVNEPFTLTALGTGEETLKLSLFGIPIKDIAVSSVESRYLIPGGEPIGVTMFTEGALIVGMSEIKDEQGNSLNPAKTAGLLSGDVITKVNGSAIENAAHLMQLIETMTQDTVEIEVTRSGQTMRFEVQPVKDSYDGKYRLGVWVRDSTAGVGTMTYYDPSNETFAGLGHAVMDVDTGKVLTIKSGEVIQSTIADVAKGEPGHPGELKGVFSLLSSRIGEIKQNSDYGIYGTLYHMDAIQKQAIPIGVQSQVEYGPAQILCTIDNQGVQAFDCEIVKINPQRAQAQKSLVVQITDEELLLRTGGIVQGMSGSPIIQNGRIIGALTHVFLNSPDKGYGIFIEWMLDQSDNIMYN